MAKDLNNLIEIFDGNSELAKQALSEGKTVLMAIHRSTVANESIDRGYSNHFEAKVELKETKENCGICACDEVADSLVYLWRE